MRREKKNRIVFYLKHNTFIIIISLKIHAFMLSHEQFSAINEVLSVFRVGFIPELSGKIDFTLPIAFILYSI